MRSAQILLLCILGMALLSTAMGNNGNIPEECCFKYYQRKIPKQAIGDYEVTRSDCSRKGVIFITKKNYRFCANPDDPFVENVMKFLDQSKF
ncbi:chemokine (C-C motif) ligand 36, duplicate 1 precursor [Esox lucius]|uniref:C-C motif chemokine n=1 Tax=Esox lucius TaxID=8010 RepID=C1BZ81_ESOLU|nr:C-C motif chemokine 36.1 precursor [Esox lucius]ACO14334.1 C-C motif chemokine 14 precursor [Esox lucius]